MFFDIMCHTIQRNNINRMHNELIAVVKKLLKSFVHLVNAISKTSDLIKN